MNKNKLSELLKKLHSKNQKSLLVLNSPREFLSVLWDLGKEIKVERVLVKGMKINFALCFVRTTKEVEKYGKLVLNNLEQNAVVWFAYPKKTSKTYKSELSPGQGWDSLAGFNTVSLIAIDNDWSALRFKKQEKRQ